MPATKDIPPFTEEDLNIRRAQIPQTSLHYRAILELKLEFGSPITTIVKIPWSAVNKRKLMINRALVLGSRQALRAWIDRHPQKHDNPKHLFVTIPRPHNKLKAGRVRDNLNALGSGIKGVSFLERLRTTYEYRKESDFSPPTCPNCSRPITGSGSYCQHCGFLIDSQLLHEQSIKERAILAAADQRNSIGWAVILPTIRMNLGVLNATKGQGLIVQRASEILDEIYNSENVGNPHLLYSKLHTIIDSIVEYSKSIVDAMPFLENNYRIFLDLFPEYKELEKDLSSKAFEDVKHISEWKTQLESKLFEVSVGFELWKDEGDPARE